MKIALINPSPSNYLIPQHGVLRDLILKKFFSIPSVALYRVAAITPPDCEVTIVDEVYSGENTDLDMDVDIVGITAVTHVASKAYEMANAFRKRGRTVVLGGIHPTIMPKEAIDHADAVVIGEAEGVWEQLIRDYQKGKMKKFYRRDSFHNLKDLPIPRWDLVKGYEGIKFSDFITITRVTRGCPYNCNYCSVFIVHGKKYRFRPIEDIILEIETRGNEYCYLLDDNLIGNREYLKRFLESLTPYRIKWAGSAAITVAKDRSLLKLLQKSGCVGLNIGFESVSKKSIKESGKLTNVVERYRDVIDELHDYGIMISANFMFGFDNDDKSIFERTLEFCLETKIDVVKLFIIVPYPGTPLYNRVKTENRLPNENWWLDDIDWISPYFPDPQPLFKPKLMSADDLLDGYLFVMKEFFKSTSLMERLRKLKITDKDWFQWFIKVLMSNLVVKEYYSPYLKM